jgi:flavin reductase (DIM6/NTAB) family NADH-FMN oxidoreductase RutF
MRRVPSPVVVVTAKGETETRGITIGSFTSVALDPPLVSFNVGRESRMYEAHLAKRFAVPGLAASEQFESVPHTRDEHGTPLLDGVSARLHCTPHETISAGDKTLYIGLVVQVDEQPDSGAVLYYKSGYRGVGRELRSTELSPVKRVSSESS